jgi:hypothetical protein
VKHALVGGERGVIASRAESARAALEQARVATARVVELIAEAELHLGEATFDPRRGGVVLEMLRAARAAADASLRDAQERADLTLDAVGLAPKEREPESERRANGFQVPPPPVPSRAGPRPR